MRATLRWSAAATLTLGLVVAVSAQPPDGGFGMMMGGGGGPAALVTSKTVLADIKATEEQTGKLKEWAREYVAKQREKMMAMREELQGLDPMERLAKFTEMQTKATAEAYKQLGDVLKEDQVKRLKQIDLQVAGLGAFSRAEVATALKITDEQKDKLRDVQTALGAEMRDLMEEYGFGRPGGGGGGFPKLDRDKLAEMQKKQAAIAKEAMGKVTAMLTDDQKTAWKELVGEPIDVAKVQSESRPQFQRKKKDD
jgi:Spy/CpxP family protein refolding chaperone